MRALQDERWCYIYNAWADGETRFRNESQSGLCFKAMQAAANSDPRIAARVKLFLHRIPEELYDLRADPHALKNLAADPGSRSQRRRLRGLLLEQMTTSGDPLVETFRAFIERREF